MKSVIRMSGLLAGTSLLAACATDGAMVGVNEASPIAIAEGVSDVSLDGTAFSSSGQADVSVFEIFRPAPSGLRSRIDYTVYDEALGLMTYNAGPSLRKRAPRPDTDLGSRLTTGHVSPFRLEGNKIYFSQFDSETVQSVSDFRQSIEEIGNKAELTALPRNEQLAYWINLHNILVIEEIAKNYPVREPYRIAAGPEGQPLHEAKLVTIKSVPLSLTDIRLNIVYRYWSDPKVIYGFFRGDLGSPNIQRSAYTRDNIGELLDRNAGEFVNSLRGVRQAGNKIYVSPIYEEARGRLFPDWPSDLTRHLEQYAEDDVAAILASSKVVVLSSYETRVADLAGGQLKSSYFNIESSTGEQSVQLPAGMERMMREYNQKKMELKLRFGSRGRVIIEDEPDRDDVPDEVE